MNKSVEIVNVADSYLVIYHKGGIPVELKNYDCINNKLSYILLKEVEAWLSND